VKTRLFAALAALSTSLVGGVAIGPVAAGTVTQSFVGLAFANRNLGAVLEVSGAGSKSSCELLVYKTSDGGATWQPPVVVSHDAFCGADSAYEMAMTPDGSWFLATPKGLVEGLAHRPGVEPGSVPRPAPWQPKGAACSLSAAGNSVFVVFAASCGLRSAGVLEVSENQGATWTKTPSPPLTSLDEAVLGSAVPDTLAALSPTSAWLVGFRRTAPDPDVRSGPLAVAGTRDTGRSWKASTLPCRTDGVDGLIAATGARLVAVCLGDPTGGYSPMEVVASSNYGESWAERCNNGPTGVLLAVAHCPEGGYPSAIVELSDGVLLMALGYTGAVDESIDGGGNWTSALRAPSSSLTLAQGAGAVWMLALGPAGGDRSLAVTANGRSWHGVALP
jgi:hypothetical protein